MAAVTPKGTKGFTIGSDTVTHPHLTSVGHSRATDEIGRSKKILEDQLRQKIIYFCYPYGNYNSKLYRILRQNGYHAALTTIQGINTLQSNLYELKRLRVTGDISRGNFIRLMTQSKQQQ